MPRGGFRKSAGRPKSRRKVHSIRATDEEWKLIKAYAERVKAGGLQETAGSAESERILQANKPESVAKKKAGRPKKLGQLAHATVIFGNPDKVKYGCFFCIPEGDKYAVKAYFCPESEAPKNIWDVLDEAMAAYGCLVPASPGSGWTWKNAEGQKMLGPDPELLARKKTIKAAFACWLSDLLVNQKAVRIKDLQTR